MDKEEIEKRATYNPAKLRKQIESATFAADLKSLAEQAFEFAELFSKNYKEISFFTECMQTSDNDKEYLLDKTNLLLENILRTDPDKPLSREMRDKIHIARGRIFEYHVNWRCGCGACKGRRAQQRYEDATPERKDDCYPVPEDSKCHEP